MFLKKLHPHLLLTGLIESLWIFENDRGHPQSSSRLIVPNGCAKIILPYRNNVYAESNTFSQKHKEGSIQLVGISEESVVVDSDDMATGTIVIELLPEAARRFFPMNMDEATNQIFSFEEIFNSDAKKLQQLIAEVSDPIKKAEALQQFLISRTNRLNIQQSIVDYCSKLIRSTNGQIRIKQLEKRTGYSHRYLNMLFKDGIGISPKTLGEIYRFQYFYKRWAHCPSAEFYKRDLYDFYHDQNHFIKEFKRFTGYTPNKYANTENEFGRLFHL